MGRNTIIINGKVYDATSGLPVAAPDPITPAKKPVKRAGQAFSDIGPSIPVNHAPLQRTGTNAGAIHTTVKKSQTLRRDGVKAPAPQQNNLRRKPQAGHTTQSPHISKFGTRKPSEIKAAPAVTEKPVVSHVVSRAQNTVSKPSAPERLSSRALKEKLIAEKLAAVDTTASAEKRTLRSLFSGKPRLASMVTACFAVVILGAYLTYLNMPNLSVRVAASQAGIAATFPDYRPDGYRFSGPVAYAPGQVSMTFKANGGNHSYTITEQSSSWDSQAVYDNLVAKQSDGGYITNSQQGLTVYTYDNKAAWVNGGILYTVDGDAPLSNEQLLNIASSL